MTAILSTLVQRVRFTPYGEVPVVSLRIGTFSHNRLYIDVEGLN